MKTKILHASAIDKRGKDEPERQSKLRENLLAIFGDKITLSPPHAWEFGLTVQVGREHLGEVAAALRDNEKLLFNFLIDLTAVDWLDSRPSRFEVVYQLLSLTYLHRLCVKVSAPESSPEVPTVSHLWPTANFMEREVWDMYGIRFAGHGDLRRILLYEEFVGHPLRKDYPLRGKQPRIPLRLPELRNTADDMFREELVSLPVRGRGSM